MKLIVATCGPKPNSHLRAALAECDFAKDLELGMPFPELKLLVRHDDPAGIAWAKLSQSWHQSCTIQYFRPQKSRYAERARLARNVAMARDATHALIVWDGHSVRVKHLVDVCRRQSVDVHLYRSDLHPILTDSAA